MAVPLRPARPSDAGELAAIHGAAFKAPWSEGDLRTLLESARVLGMIAPGAGFALTRVAADEAEVLTIAVRPEHQGEGVGAALLEAAQALAAEAGAAQMHLEVAVDNARALRLYERAGFARSGRRRGYYARPDGRVDALVLTRVLPPPGAPG